MKTSFTSGDGMFIDQPLTETTQASLIVITIQVERKQCH